MTSDPIRLGVVGLGRGFSLTAEALAKHDQINLLAAATRSPMARAAFEKSFGGTAYENLQDLLADERIEMVYVATPHALHVEHVVACIQAGKHVVVEKPMAITLKHAKTMVAAAAKAGVHLIVGPSHSFDAPVLKAAEMIESGRLGKVRMLHALNCTEFLYRPRRPEELDTAKGGGVVYSQAVHQIDVARRLIGARAVRVMALTGKWDHERPTEGAYSVLIQFETGAFASLTYSGYAHFDSDRWMGHISELGYKRPQTSYGAARRHLQSGKAELAQKKQRAFTGFKETTSPIHHEHFGPVIAFCEKGDLQLTAQGVTLFGHQEIEEFDVPFFYSRQTFADSLVQTLRGGTPPPQDGAWGLASLEICNAILESAATASPILLNLQKGPRDV